MKRLVFPLCILLALLSCACTTPRERAAKSLDAYTIEARFDGRQLTGHMTYTLTNRSDDTTRTEQAFSLFARAYRKDAVHAATENISEYGDITLNNVCVGGKPAEVRYEGADGELAVVPLGEIFPGKRATITMDYTLTVPTADHRLGRTATAFHLANFYPTACVYRNGEAITSAYTAYGDPFCLPCSNYNVSLTLPEGFTVAATGKGTLTEDGDGTVTYSYREQALRDFAFVLYPKAQTAEQEHDGVRVRVLSATDNDLSPYLTLATQALSFFSQYADYPYATLDVCLTPLEAGGMEYPALVMISTSASDRNAVIVHELAHQWWYGLVGNDQTHEAWLDEGLTEFCTSLFFDAHPDYGVTKTDRLAESLRAYLTYTDVYDAIYGHTDTSMSRALTDFANAYEYQCMTYAKGELLMNELYTMLGEKAFTKALARYAKDNAYRIASASDWISALERTSRRHLASYISSWTSGEAVIA